MEEKKLSLISKLKNNNLFHPYSQIDNLLKKNDNESPINNFLIEHVSRIVDDDILTNYRLDAILQSYSIKKYKSRQKKEGYSIYEYQKKYEIYISSFSFEKLKNIIIAEDLPNYFTIQNNNKKTSRLNITDAEKINSKINEGANVKITFEKKKTQSI